MKERFNKKKTHAHKLMHVIKKQNDQGNFIISDVSINWDKHVYVQKEWKNGLCNKK